ncbi:MAG: PAS domain S-box protein [Calditrichia bacterium]|nr:PAS domain S-box protein [Calditrichia bacterium]
MEKQKNIGYTNQFFKELENSPDVYRDVEVALRKREHEYQLVFKDAPVGIVILDIEGHFLRINQKYCEITGYSEEELLKMRTQDITHPDDVQSTDAIVKRIISSKEPSHSFIKRYINKDGLVVCVEITGNLLKNN